jgi:hypothetical protein
MKEMIDEARNAHVDSPQSGDGKHLPNQEMSPVSHSVRSIADCEQWYECPTTSPFKCPQMTADCPRSGSRAS